MLRLVLVKRAQSPPVAVAAADQIRSDPIRSPRLLPLNHVCPGPFRCLAVVAVVLLLSVCFVLQRAAVSLFGGLVWSVAQRGQRKLACEAASTRAKMPSWFRRRDIQPLDRLVCHNLLLLTPSRRPLSHYTGPLLPPRAHSMADRDSSSSSSQPPASGDDGRRPFSDGDHVWSGQQRPTDRDGGVPRETPEPSGSPELLDALCAQGEAHFREHRFREAEADLWRAAQGGHARAMVVLGLLLRGGHGLGRQELASRTLFKRAAELLHPYGVHQYACSLSRGWGTHGSAATATPAATSTSTSASAPAASPTPARRAVPSATASPEVQALVNLAEIPDSTPPRRGSGSSGSPSSTSGNGHSNGSGRSGSISGSGDDNDSDGSQSLGSSSISPVPTAVVVSAFIRALSSPAPGSSATASTSATSSSPSPSTSTATSVSESSTTSAAAHHHSGEQHARYALDQEEDIDTSSATIVLSPSPSSSTTAATATASLSSDLDTSPTTPAAGHRARADGALSNLAARISAEAVALRFRSPMLSTVPLPPVPSNLSALLAPNAPTAHLVSTSPLSPTPDEVSQLVASALPQIIELAHAGDWIACYLYAYSLHQGFVVPQDLEAARDWYARTVELQRLPVAIFNLGLLADPAFRLVDPFEPYADDDVDDDVLDDYDEIDTDDMTDDGERRNFDERLGGASDTLPAGTSTAGVDALRGVDAPPPPAFQRVPWPNQAALLAFTRAAECRHTVAQYTLARIYIQCSEALAAAQQYGLDAALANPSAFGASFGSVPFAELGERGLMLMHQVAEQDYQLALFFLARTYRTGRFGVAPEPARARGFALRAAQLGHAASQALYGHMLHHGEGGDGDVEGAVAWYSLALCQGYAAALIPLCHAKMDCATSADHVVALDLLLIGAELLDLPQAAYVRYPFPGCVRASHGKYTPWARACQRACVRERERARESLRAYCRYERTGRRGA